MVPTGKGEVAVLEPLPLLPPYLHRQGHGGIVENLDKSVHN